ncbi:fungal-specific transcription factor domain-containing protein [Dactylonectria estremocensis]|uniref:Fungal-specific transcription factor domain-containing protein n=1 Tax=Dactylonectria estremocensis TaxID=1079267 RepID=A0A9P9EX43_9HYPO|nr:fungal-specific transcription factor domain-containing protein [Dactylonectria estremocensis]
MASRARATLASDVPAGSQATSKAAREPLKTSQTSRVESHVPKRSRAASACVHCRARKVRCSAEDGTPCASCCWDEVDHLMNHFSDRSCRNSAQRSKPMSTALDQRVENDPYPRPSAEVQSIPNCDSSLLHFAFINDAAPSKDSQAGPLVDVPEMGRSPPRLPAFLRPLPPSITPEDADYLRAKGALTIPSVATQNALLNAFVNYVYPFMPLISLHEFLGIACRRDGANGQLLYDFDYESDPCTLIQALLLMTYWHESSDNQKDASHWIGVAISLAYTISSHPPPENTPKARPSGCESIQSPNLWKRIWWSCFMRDRLVALGLRRPMKIREAFDLSMLEVSDFEIQALSRTDTTQPVEFPLLHSIDMQQELALRCISKVKLCICLGHTLTVQYSILSRENVSPNDTTNSTMFLSPNKNSNIQTVEAVDMELMAWEASLPKCCEYRSLNARDATEGKSTITLHRTLLHMLHCATISALHRPRVLPAFLRRPSTPRSRVWNAATRITEMVMGLNHLKLEGFLPPGAIMAILPAMIVHMIEMKNSERRARERATQGFRECKFMMEQLREIYEVADFATEVLDAGMKKTGLDVKLDRDQLRLAILEHVSQEPYSGSPMPGEPLA